MTIRSLLALSFVLVLGLFVPGAGGRASGGPAGTSARGFALATEGGSRMAGQAGRVRAPDPSQTPAERKEERPLSIGDIVSMLEQTGQDKLSQGDIAAQVFKRGISFTPTERAMESIRAAGAGIFLLDTIQRVSQPDESVSVPKLRVRGSDAATNPGGDPSGEPDAETEREARRRAKAEMMSRMPLIEQARYHALDFAAELPNFVVNQLVTRSIQMPGARNWRVEDRLDVQLTYRADKGEEYKLISIDGKPARQAYD